ncbi:MAG: hypothetical protein ABSD98_14580 [Candidatus Korobacteraceae bacterium]|jgi:N-acetylglucosamine-6-phosphate deacetylase
MFPTDCHPAEARIQDCDLGHRLHKGVLQAGADADVVVFSPTGEVRQTIAGGIVA